MNWIRLQWSGAVLGMAVLAAVWTPGALAVSCTTSSALSSNDRSALQTTAMSLGMDAAHGDANALQNSSAPSLKSSFGDVTSIVTGMKDTLAGATVTVQNLYALHASDLKAADDDVQFFCGVPGSQMQVTVTLEQLPPGEFALAIVHASGVVEPQQFAFILQNTAATGIATGAAAHWALAGFFVRPLTLAGYPAVWFWQQGRALKAKNDPMSAFLYYQAAEYLSRPADLYTSSNLGKLSHEMAAAEPQGLPGSAPMQIVGAAGTTFAVTGFRIDTGLGQLDVRVDAKVETLGDPVASRKFALELMGATLSKFPDLRGNFHGIWVYETAANGQTYAVEQPMSALP